MVFDYLPSTRRMVLFSYLAVAVLPYVLAGPAVCTNDSMNWSFNTVGDSPCQMAAELTGMCFGNTDWPPTLHEGYVYVGPLDDNPCMCNTVVYSLVSACAACQSEQWIELASFTENCVTISYSEFPYELPSGLRIPAWAYKNFGPDDNIFVITQAQLVDGPESVAAPRTTGQATTRATTRTGSTVTASVTTSITTNSTNIGTTSIQTTDTTSNPTSSTASVITIFVTTGSATAGSISTFAFESPGTSESSSRSNVGTIAGGVIGGLAILAGLIGVIVFLFKRASRHSKHGLEQDEPSTQASTGPRAPHVPTFPGLQDKNNEMSYSSPAFPTPSFHPEVLCDPENPRTFPPGSPSTTLTSSALSYSPSSPPLLVTHSDHL